MEQEIKIGLCSVWVLVASFLVVFLVGLPNKMQWVYGWVFQPWLVTGLKKNYLELHKDWGLLGQKLKPNAQIGM